MLKHARFLVPLLLAAIIVSCAPNTTVPVETFPSSAPSATPETFATVAMPPTPMALSLYRAPEIPDALVAESDAWGIPLIMDPSQAPLHLELALCWR